MGMVETIHADSGSSRLSSLVNPASRIRSPSQPKPKSRNLLPRPCRCALAFLLITSLACSALTPIGGSGGGGSASPTPSPTGFGGVPVVPTLSTPSPNDKHWTGKVHTTSSEVSQTPDPTYGTLTTSCSNEQVDSTFDAYVAQDGTISGTGEANFIAVPQCSIDQQIAEKQEAKQAHFSVTGTFDGKEFKLFFPEFARDGATWGFSNYSLLDTDGLAPAIIVPVTGTTTAAGTTHMNFIPKYVPDTTVTAEHQVEMQCLNCGLP